MAFKMVPVFLVLALASQALCRNVVPSKANALIEVEHRDRNIDHIMNPMFGVSMSLPHLVLDTLEACIAIFPDGLTYEIYPNSNLPSFASIGGGAFKSCGFGLKPVTPSMNGVYELQSITTHWDGRRTLQKQKFILNARERED